MIANVYTDIEDGLSSLTDIEKTVGNCRNEIAKYIGKFNYR